jgi:hypothetical protein
MSSYSRSKVRDMTRILTFHVLFLCLTVLFSHCIKILHPLSFSRASPTSVCTCNIKVWILTPFHPSSSSLFLYFFRFLSGGVTRSSSPPLLLHCRPFLRWGTIRFIGVFLPFISFDCLGFEFEVQGQKKRARSDLMEQGNYNRYLLLGRNFIHQG